MKVQIRKKLVETAEGLVNSSKDIFEWSPAPNRWYTVHQRNIQGLYPEGDGELTRNLFNALLQGLTCIVEAKYFRNRKILEIKL